MAIHFIAPTLADAYCGPWYGDFGIFIAGTIEMGKSRNWQKEFAEAIQATEHGTDVILYNPRRFDFDATQEQSINNPYMFEQIDWEMTRLEKSNLIVFNFEPNTISPISIGELFMYAKDHSKKVLVHCPEGYQRKANIDYVCQKYNVQQVDSFDALISETKNIIAEWRKTKM